MTTCARLVSLGRAELTPLSFTQFGEWAVGSRSTPRAYVLHSTGTAAIHVDKVSFSPESGDEWGVLSDMCTGKSLAPGASCQVLLSFGPTRLGASTPMVRIWHNAEHGSHGGQLEGHGRPPMTVSAWGWNGVTALGAVSAWGLNNAGQIGDGTTVDRHVPTPVPGLSYGVTAVSAGVFHTLAIDQVFVKAWGCNGMGQLGDGTTTDRLQPVSVLTAERVKAIAAGAHHSLAITSTGNVLGWGWNDWWQLGTNERVTIQSTPASTGISQKSVTSAGVLHSLGG